MNEELDQVLTAIQRGTLLVSDARDSSSAQWKKFRQVVDVHGKVVTTSKSPRGYAVCRQCAQVCPVGRRGGMSALDKHRCHKPKEASKSPKPVEKKTDKNQAEKERKEEIAALIKDVACLVLGQESYNKNNLSLQELTKLRLVRACLSELPFSILQFVSDGKSPGERPLEFYGQLVNDLGRLLISACQAQDEALSLSSRSHSNDSMPNTVVVPQRRVTPSLHLRLSYPAPGDDNPDITWASTEVEKGMLGFNRTNIIGRNLSDLVHPEDYMSIQSELLSRGTRDQQDFAFPECRVAEPQRRSKSAIDYRHVFLSCTIRPCPRALREKEPVLKADAGHANLVMPWKRGAWPRLALFLTLPAYYRYMTLHSLDGRIIQADERITMITGYTCDEVVGKLAYQYIPESSTFYVTQARERWLESRESAVISYPLKAKVNGSIIYLRSEGELVEYRDETTGQLMNGFILVNSLIHEDDYKSEMHRQELSSTSSSGLPAVTDSPWQGNEASITEHYDLENYGLTQEIVPLSTQSCLSSYSSSCSPSYSPTSSEDDEFGMDTDDNSFERQRYQQMYSCNSNPMNEAPYGLRHL